MPSSGRAGAFSQVEHPTAPLPKSTSAQLHRLAYAEVLPDERARTVVGFLRRALGWFRRRGIEAQRILSDNGNAYRSHLFAAACRAHRLAQRFTRPYTPRTNGKAERFIHNYHRRHGALHNHPPISRVVGQDELLRVHT